jgi:hypothetical protein
VKSSYPFHYAVDLAESLCKRAKGKAKTINKDLPPSCLMFHKVQDSFVEDFEKIIERELTPQKDLSFEFGPYYCGEHEHGKETTVKTLLENVDLLRNNNAIKSHLRQWLSALFDNVGAADQMMKRLKTIHESETAFIGKEFLNLSARTEKVVIPFYDVLSLASILFKETKK